MSISTHVTVRNTAKQKMKRSGQREVGIVADRSTCKQSLTSQHHAGLCRKAGSPHGRRDVTAQSVDDSARLIRDVPLLGPANAGTPAVAETDKSDQARQLPVGTSPGRSACEPCRSVM
jgi:hypothetical protein